MRTIVIAWFVMQLGGCTVAAVPLVLQGVGDLSTWSAGPVPDACIHTTGATRDRCFAHASHLSDEAAEGWAIEQKQRRENAAARATGERLEREKRMQSDRTLRPEELDTTMIANTLTTVTPTVRACPVTTHGNVEVHVQVAADGHVVEATVTRAPDAPLGTCVVAAVQHARFTKPQRGGAFRYPFVF